MGDYKLKSSPKYIVPEHERVNTEKKKRQFHLLKDSIQLLKEQFNGFVVQLRERKVRLVQDVGEWSKQVASINNELRQLGVDVPDSVWRPQIGDAAFPENRYIVTDRDVAKYQRQEAERQARLKAGDEDPLGGFNANRGKAIRDAALAAAADSNSEDPVTDAGGVGFVASMPSIAMNTPYCVAIVDHQDVDLKAGVRTVNGHSVGLSDLERSQLNARVTILQYRKVRLNKKIEAAVKLFDQDVDRLATERLLLEGGILMREKYVRTSVYNRKICAFLFNRHEIRRDEAAFGVS